MISCTKLIIAQLRHYSKYMNLASVNYGIAMLFSIKQSGGDTGSFGSIVCI